MLRVDERIGIGNTLVLKKLYSMFNFFHNLDSLFNMIGGGGDLYNNLITWRFFTMTMDIPYKLQNT